MEVLRHVLLDPPAYVSYALPRSQRSSTPTRSHLQTSAKDRPVALVSGADYLDSTLYDLSDVDAPKPLFKLRGWAIRLFKVR